MSLKMGFIGAGQMASALARAFVNSGVATADKITLSDPNPCEALIEYGLKVTKSNVEVVTQNDIIICAVKPYVVKAVLTEVGGLFTPDKLLISIATGVKIEEYQKLMPEGSRVIRVMPNTPCLVGESASAIAKGKFASDADLQMVHRLMTSCGVCHEVEEVLMDAVTGLSGSGPAYVYMMIESLADAGVKNGLKRDVALSLASQTVKGAAEMVIKTKVDPAVLKQSVCSPGGTTIAAVVTLEREGFRNAIIQGVDAAVTKSEDLGKKK